MRRAENPGMLNLKATFVSLLLIASIPAMAENARKVVFEKLENGGHRWKVIQAPVPSPADNQVLVRVHAVGLNRGDIDMRERKTPKDFSGQVPGYDGAGEVIAVGKQVKTLRKGMRVTNTFFKNWVDGPFNDERLKAVPGWTADGMLADYVLLDETDAVPIANTLSYEEASTLPTAAVTAWNAVNAHPKLTRGDYVLVQGTGGVAAFALQFAVLKGARVIVTSSSDDKLARAKALGAFGGINYKTEPTWSESALKLTNQHGVDLVIDIGGKSTLEQSVNSLANAGTLAIVGGLTGYDGSISAWGLLKKYANAQSIFVGSRADFIRMNAYIDEHKLKPVIERVYPFEEYEQALSHLASGNFVGKIVLRLR